MCCVIECKTSYRHTRVCKDGSQNRAQYVTLGWDYAPSFPTVKVKLSCDLAMTAIVGLQPGAPW
jgi:hypothetical protein